MAKLVLLHKPNSIYADDPPIVYDFPRQYLKAMSEAVGDWIIYYEPTKAGSLGYFAVARVQQVIAKPGEDSRYLALIEPGSYLDFATSVPRRVDGVMMESALAEPDGSPKSGGLVQSAVRRLPDADFARILSMGLPVDLEEREARRYDTDVSALAEHAALFERPILERLTRRPYRDIAFRKVVREAYDFRCAMSGLQLRNGGGRPEVQVAHIKPVERGGDDWVRNGLALSGTLHWMFDRGLISVAADCETIIVSHNKVPGEVVGRLIRPNGKLWTPDDPRHRPLAANLHWHRENIFGQSVPDGQTPWN